MQQTDTVVFEDLFDRTVTDDWADTTHLWVNSGGIASEYDVAGGVATQVHGTVNQLHHSLVDAGTVNPRIRTVTSVAVAAATGATITKWVIGRSDGVSNYYSARLDLETAGTLALRLVKRVNGTLSTIATAVLTGAYGSGALWAIDFWIDGTTLYAKAWPVNSHEPPDWQLVAPNQTDLTSGTLVGLASRREAGNTNNSLVVSWHEITVTSDEPYEAALAGGEITWAGPRLSADWDGDGHGPAGSIDDLSGLIGDTYSVVHALDDGLPDEVSFVAGTGTGTLSAPLVDGRQGMRASEYFSPFNNSSPLSGYDRDLAPVTLTERLVTPEGPVDVTIFTGQLANVPVRKGTAALWAVSAARLKLSKTVQPSPIHGQIRGLNASWPISFALAECGINASPPARAGCRLWMPMHGSLQPFLPKLLFTRPDLFPPSDDTFLTAVDVTAAHLVGELVRPTFLDDAPYLLASEGFVTPSRVKLVTGSSVLLADGDDLLSQGGSRGRVEFWVRGDAANINTSPGGSGNYPTNGSAYFTAQVAASSAAAEVAVRWDRTVRVRVHDATNSRTLTHSTPLPSDGGWHFIGGAWDVDGDKLWVRLDGVTETSTPAMTTATLPVADNFAAGFPVVQFYLPVAEFQVTAGDGADPDTSPWLNEPDYWDPDQVVMRPSTLDLVALTETAPREAWEMLGSYALAELAVLRMDERDRVLYLPRPYWEEPAQQVPLDTISTVVNAGALDIDVDPTLVRNEITVNFTDVTVSGNANVTVNVPVLDLQEIIAVPPGESVLRRALAGVVVNINRSVSLLAGAEVDDAADNLTGYDNITFVTLNTDQDGSGAYADSGDVTVTVSYWDAGQVELTFDNGTATTYYTANDGTGVPAVRVTGSAVEPRTASVQVSDSASIAQRGERSLVVPLSAIQSRAAALEVADRLLADLASPVITVDEIEVIGDPRRQPGDLVTLDDAVDTGAAGNWRITSVRHERAGADYRQYVRLVRFLGA
jgi:hypothetical protein